MLESLIPALLVLYLYTRCYTRFILHLYTNIHRKVMDAYASKASQGQMIASAMGRQMVSRREQFYSTSVEDLANRVPAINLVNPYVTRMVRVNP